MLVVRWLEPHVAEDMALAPAVADVVNRAYAQAEDGLFLTKIDRTNPADVAASISRRETAVAVLDGVLVGAIRAATLDERASWFGALGVDPAVLGRGLGDTLVAFVEEEAAGAGNAEMQLEVFESEPAHPHLSRIRAWYERCGYRETSRRPIAAVYPDDAAWLAVEALDIVTMRKPLRLW
jgi:ribosomal protein S18 acetylase RimI-like enzyme